MEDQLINYGTVIYDSIAQLLVDVVAAVPYLIVGIIIWMIGQWLIDLAADLVKKINLRGTQFDDHLVRLLVPLIRYVGKFFLVLIILDYFGIGETVIGAVLNAFTFAVAISLGLAFGRAFETDAKAIYKRAKTEVMK